jgi:outer membrane protein assembly factor BamB
MGDTPWGYGLVKMDKNSKVIWKYFDYVHHHLDVTEDGKIYVLTNNIRNNVIKGYEYLAPPRIDDSVVVLSPEGKRIKKVSIMDAMLRSPYGRMMRSIAWDIKQDYLHTNSIEYIDGATAAKLPFAKEGQVLLSMRDIDTVAVLDLDKEEIVWAIQGSWHRQHDADLLSNGHVMLFDNWGHYEPGGGSRVIEFDPVTLEMVWDHTGDEKHLFSSPIRSGQERLPNGNTLITESDGGRLLEVTPGGEIVWEYINPVRGGGQGKLIPVLSQGVDRIEPKALDSSFLSLINRRNSPTRTSAISG